ncbi:MAG: type II secretion system F family protein, partial [Candidatus Omnitrophica bacterium]|nr:type II secretion system F family protein [Candidatus Omnitrophota bacterium]
MTKFSYVAKDRSGNTVKGEIESSAKNKAIETLRSNGMLVLKLDTAKAGFSFSFKMGSKGKVQMEELVVFSRQMATLTGSGITIVNSLDTLADQVEKENFKQILKDIKNSVNTGTSLSEAMEKYEATFSSYFVNMIKAGESSGTLEEALERVAAYLEKTNGLQKKIKSAMTYPAVVTGMALVITLVMIIKVIPVFQEMFSGVGAELPGPTLFLINLSNFMRKYFWLAAILIAGAIFGIRWYMTTAKGRRFFDKMQLNMPVFGPLLKKVAISKFTRTLSTLVKSGVPILAALDIVSKTSGNVVVEEAVKKVQDSVRQGETIAGPMEKSGLFPPLVTRMVAVGEK